MRMKWEKHDGIYSLRPQKGIQKALHRPDKWVGNNRVYYFYVPLSLIMLWDAAMVTDIINLLD